MAVFREIQNLILEERSFVVYAKPNSSEITLWIQNNNELVEFQGQNGFVFCSFDKERNYILETQNSTIKKFNIKINSISFKNSFEEIGIEEKNNFENLVKKGIHAIESDDFQKVVLSRKITIQENVNILESFTNLLNAYPNAFRYLFCHEKIGIWIGATPEQLLKIENKKFETVALAGTQLFQENVIWQSKEIEEQQLVIDYIKNQIKNVAEDVTIEEPKTVLAGNLVHLKSKIFGKLIHKSLDMELLYDLHPTSAVCGMPYKNAFQFINQNEGYDRKFYSGFIGEWNLENKSDIYVNLRCCEIEEQNLIHIYVGCGITKDSNPEKEFKETVNKSKTIRNILV